ncbi:MAG: hybrid sensor histidine kinase/response regulator [Stappia sp.]|uniref:PAS-domain containing protein n=1 Tax=Stappia sp. TaxID=1870903 RepID=UPI000C3DD45F|nr:PAS-domain containing protein [Stappia sp.]MAA98880.1 hybrid sensor histidine kinase/response regulator [Stappia sp.]MBM21575.1 hybrid sensor histidine kinase/response regulator [Stappia sp.]
MESGDLERERLDLLQAALDHINQGFSVFDAQLQLVAWNRQLFEMLEFPLHLARRGAPLSAFLEVNAARGEYGPGNVAELVARRVERAALFEPHSFERVRPDGQVVLVTGAPLPSGGFVTTYTDITREREQQANLERTVAERTRQLRQSEDWLRLVTDNVPALVAYVGPGPVYRFANRRYAKWFDQTVESMVGRPVADIIGPALYPELEPHIMRAFEGKAVSYEYTRTRAGGRVAHMRSTLIPDRTLDGRTLGCFVLSLDVTEHKRSEAALAQARRMEAVGQLSGGLAHDFNNLLTIIIGNVLALRRKSDAPAMPDLSGHIDPILQAAQRGAELTRRLLAFARGEASDARPVRLSSLLSGMEGLLSGSLPRGLTLSVTVGERDPVARVDPAELENALVNLVLNARDASPDGGNISLVLDETEIAAADAEPLGLVPGPYARIRVKDTGHGMSEDVRRQAFDPFFSTKPFGTGSGLGLPTVYGFARRAGGCATVESRPGHGTTVALFLPLSRDEDTAGDPHECADAPRGAGELILLVEDEPDVADVVREQLCALGYAVLVTGEADDALDLVTQIADIRAVLSDIVMPGQSSGLALAEAIGNRRPDLPIALMSGYREGTASEAPPAWPVLAKPFTTGLLARTMSEILSS